MTSLDNHAHDGYCVGSSSEREVLDMEEYYGIDDFAEEVGFRCGDDDIMVEVLGSDVYVDGICGDGIGGDQCFTDVLASDDKLDTKLRPYGAVGISRKDSRLRDTFDDSASASSGKEGSVVSKSPHRFGHEWNDTTDCTRKERRSTELMGDPGEYLEEASSSWKRHKVHDPSISSGTKDVEKGINISEDITTSCSGAKPSLKLTGSDTGSMESNGERSENGNCALLNGFEIFISELGEVQFPEHSLEQLQFAASNPLDGHEELIILNSEPSEAYQFEDSNDSYWTDRVIASNLQDQQYYEYEGETMIEDSRKLSTLDREPSKAKESSSLEGDCLLVDDNSPAELVVIFPKTGSFPVAATLNKTLKMFGPLKESETQVDRKSNRARVVFRKFGDAKVAFSSAQKYSIFGPLDVKYQLNHPISDP